MQAPVPLAGSISIAYVQGLVDHLERRGVAPQRLLAGARLDPAVLDQREARIAASVYVDLLELGLALSGDADLGLHLGEAVRPGHFGVLGYLLMSCATLGDALHRQARYAELVGSLGRVELADEPPRAGHEPLVRHRWEPLLPRQQRQLAEETLACWLRFGHWISGRDQAPLEVRFRHPAPADTAEHRRIFRCPVLFGQADNALVFPRRLLALPLEQADSQIQRTLDAYAGRLLESIRRGDGVLERARQCLAERLPEQAVDLEALAGELALSPRTLQRRLRDSGLSFSRLVDETRQQLVLHHLRDPALELADVASLVGFSETGSLARAFRRWTGQSLGQYRRTLQPLADS
ncbi:AraC-type DNA-binding protein [Pseudomonas delhiensis]|uniref:AraC-type DNA-binding protein n=1 Tax=Pseudomonas delhiensis TaxID=366289 RepID=A0A239GZR9_9PSED|nr:AraC family transcriptional regulator [Pseudomonas delhiensis]SDI81641.1 AraC-type DNA-binding protein [Pseudomonas delhiensis]SNS74402.1 AraC-type DNA-binding protein [Pseudomonas delhiensis]